MDKPKPPAPLDLQDPKVRARLNRALLIGLQRPEQSPEEARGLLDELNELVTNLGVEVEGELMVKLRGDHPRHLVGTGKMEEIAALAKGLDCGRSWLKRHRPTRSHFRYLCYSGKDARSRAASRVS